MHPLLFQCELYWEEKLSEKIGHTVNTHAMPSINSSQILLLTFSYPP